MSQSLTSSTSDNLALPETLCDLQATIAEAGPTATGILWRLAESGRQLDANLVRLAPNEGVGRHAEPDLDVLLIVVAGAGTMASDVGELALSEGAVTWMPRHSARSIAAGAEGLAYVTVHRRRPGMQIRSRPDHLPPPPPPHR
ncbi:MAG: hypothetical protein ABI384_07680 [Allobranchiibius sp.]